MSDEFHRAKISASKVGALAECPSMLVRDEEMHLFCDERGVPTVSELTKESRGSKKGTDIHEVLASFPLFIPEFGIGGAYSIYAELDHKIHSGKFELDHQDRWLVKRYVERRDDMVSWFVENVALGASRIETDIDKNRMFDEFYENSNGVSHVRSGLADVRVRAHFPDGTVKALILDYKTGRGTTDNSVDNQQLLNLGVLSRIEEPGTDEVYASLITHDSIRQPMRLVFFDKAKLDEGLALMDEVSERVTTLLDAYNEDRQKTGSSTPSDELQEKLDAAAKVGDQCRFCDGKLCCGAFREKILADRERLEVIQQFYNKPEEETMTDDKFREMLILASEAKSFATSMEKFLGEANELGKAMMEKGLAFDGVKLQDGSERFGVKNNENGDPIMDIEEIASLLMEKFPRARKGEFIKAVAKISGPALKGYLSEVGNAPAKKDELKAWLVKNFGEDSPFDFSQNAPSVKIEKAAKQEVLTAVEIAARKRKAVAAKGAVGVG